MKHRRSVTTALAALFLAGAPLATPAATLPPAPGAPAASFDVGTLHVDRYGSASDAVILIPGLASGPWAWYGVIPALAATKRVYVVTLPGFDGRAPQAEPGGLFATTESDLEALIGREHLVRPVIVGHSMGGTLAFGFAEQYPTASRAIVSVDALPVELGVAYQPDDERAKQAQMAAANFAAATTPAAQRALAMQNAATLGAIDPALYDEIQAREARSDHATVAQDLGVLVGTDLRPELSKITEPVLVVMPYDLADSSTPPSVQPPIVFTQNQKLASYRALLTGVKNLTIVPVAPSRHFVMLDAPAAFESALTTFLDAHPPSGG